MDRKAVTLVVQVSGFGLIAAGILLVAATLLQPALPTAPSESRVFALGADSTYFRLSAVIRAVSAAVEITSIFGLLIWLLGHKRTGLALTGTIMTIFGGAMFLPIFGVFMIILPSVGNLIASGNDAALEVITSYYGEWTAMPAFIGGFIYFLRPIPFGIAMLKLSGVAKWVGVGFIVSGVLYIPAFLDIVVLQKTVPVLHGFCLMIVGYLMCRPVNGENTVE